jgi:hypothetical protein
MAVFHPLLLVLFVNPNTVILVRWFGNNYHFWADVWGVSGRWTDAIRFAELAVQTATTEPKSV